MLRLAELSEVYMAKTMGKCQLCGEVAELTADHLPQKSLYPKEIRGGIGNLNTVLACINCNNSAKVVDELLKVIVGLVGNAPWREQMLRSVDATLSKNRRLSSLITDNTKIESHAGVNGQRAEVRVFKLPPTMNDQFFAPIERIVKGLFFQEFGKVLVEHYELSIFWPEAISPSLSEQLKIALASATWKSLNNETLVYGFVPLQASDIVCAMRLHSSFELYFVMKEIGWRDHLV